MDKKFSTDGIVLLAKKPGLTSFSSLHAVKHALGTSKVGHTGTLDSFAQGLLVVCTGRLTKLAGCITEFDKSYEAVIKFGQKTDTLEYTGEIILTAPLPTQQALTLAVEKFKGKLLQSPPAFSAIHVNGKRASDLAREGKTVEIPPRAITVFSSEIKETKLNESGLVEYARINFSVSKGTYIRCLARDIAKEAGSAGHLTGLYRTRVGNFDIKDSAGFNDLPEFTIETAIKTAQLQTELAIAQKENQNNTQKKNHPDDSQLQAEIRQTIRNLDEDTAKLCGFIPILLKDSDSEKDFCNGKPLRSALFGIDLHTLPENSVFAVFSQEKVFRGLIEKESGGRFRHRFVIN